MEKESLERQIGQRLRKLRQLKDISQGVAAKVLGVHRHTIAAYENGAHAPDGTMLVKMAIYFGVTTDYIVGLEDNNLLDIMHGNDATKNTCFINHYVKDIWRFH